MKSWRRSARTRPLRSRISLVVAVALVGQAVLTAGAQAAPLLAAPAAPAAPAPGLGHPVKVTEVPRRAAERLTPAAPYEATATTFPAKSNGRVALGTSKARAAFGGPVWAEGVADGAAGYTGPSSVDVQVLDHRAALAAGVSGLLAEVTPVGGGRGKARIGVDYQAFAQAYGGDYASRLHLVAMPACALTTPEVPDCRVQTPLETDRDPAAGALSAVVPLSAATGAAQPQTPDVRQASFTAAAPAAAPAAFAGTMLIAATSGVSSGDGGGDGGQYGATSLSPSGSWAAGSASGSFTYSYPISLPPAASELTPKIQLSYDSGSVDGKTASTQAQSSWIGEGWAMADSYVEQTFVSCSGSPEGITQPAAKSTGDTCYDGPLLTVSLNGSSTSLIWDAGKSTWKTSDDAGAVVTHVTGSNNGSGTFNTDYWTLTDRSGTVYSFGRNQLPGWSSGKAVTNSVDSEPVYSANPGDPCYNATFANAVCTTAYRWHLDYVKDLHGNAMSYWYKQDTNYYGRNNGATMTPYVRDSHLDRIDYGFTDGSAYGTVADRVSFTTGDRCVTGTCQPLNAANAANWPDVPFDLVCAQGATCTSTSPGFFSTVRLTGIATSQWNGSAYAPVDTWALAQSIPTTGTYNTSTLWLDSITHTGKDTSAGGPEVPLPPVTFHGAMMANRVDYTTGNGSGLGPLNRYRIDRITTETGSAIGVEYTLPDACTPAGIQGLDPATNTSSCYPVNWTPKFMTDPYTDWFNKYVVKSVSQSDPSGGSAGLYTAYTYKGGGAWHHDDNEVVKAKYRTWGQWRGYGDVQTRTGQGADPLTLSESWFYRGMDGDWLSPTSTRTVNLADSQGGTHRDSDQLSGSLLESAAYTYDGGPVDHSSINSYWVSAPTASRTRTGLPPLTANATGKVETWTRQAVSGGWRTTETDTSYDTDAASPTFGLPLYNYDHGDLALAGTAKSQESCDRTAYAPANTALNLSGLPAESETDAKPCAGANPGGASAPTDAQLNKLTAPTGLNRATDVVTATRTFYDNPTMAATWPQPTAPAWPQAAPTKGDQSVLQVADGYSGGAFTYRTKGSTLTDSFGKPSKIYDGAGHATTTGYTRTSYLTTTGLTVTNALGQSQVTTLDPMRGLSLSTTDMNGITTTAKADGLGRTIAVWRAGRPTSAPADELYDYAFPAVGSNAPPVVTTKALNESSGYSVSTVLLDSLLRTRQTQNQAVTTAAGRIVSDTFYDSHGWAYKTNSNYWDKSSDPNGTLVSAADNAVDQQTLTSYDGLGRPTVVTSLYEQAVRSTGYSQYLGDRVISVPPTGGTAGATVTDALDHTTEVDQYTTAPTVTTAVTGGFTTATVTGGTTSATKHTYDALGRPSQVVDALGNTWTTRYDFLGQTVSTTDPDSGSTPAGSPMLYDKVGNLLQISDSTGNTASFTYDALNRQTARYDVPLSAQSGATPVATWGYDNSNNAVPGMVNAKGRLTTVTSNTPAGAFVTQAQGFTARGASTGEDYTVPGSNDLAGKYSYRHSYSPTVGLPKSDLIPAAGGMPLEVLTTGYAGYRGLDKPATLGGTNGYTQSTAYTALGQVAATTVGAAASPAGVNYDYDPHTGALDLRRIGNTSVSTTPYDATSYTYDPAGNVTAQSSVRNGAATETQCYTYDPLDRLSQAWTTAGAAGTCATRPTAQNVATTVGDGVSGAAYWTSWTFDVLGQPKSQVQHALSPVSADTTTTYAYGGSATGCANAGTGAHTLASTSTTGNTTATGAYCYNSLGATTSRPTSAGQQSLTWDKQGKLQTATTNGATSTYYYGAGGDVIERVDPGTITVFLPDQQITLNTTTSAKGNTRTYSLPGGGQAVLTNTAVSFLFGDQHSTGAVSLDANGKNPAWKQYTPYGAPRGSAPGSSWLDKNGFLGDPVSTNAELTTIGARQYDTALGRFISLDPVLEGDPQQQNGYTYAADNPVTHSDPTGLRLACGGVGSDIPCPTAQPGAPAESCAISGACQPAKPKPPAKPDPVATEIINKIPKDRLDQFRKDLQFYMERDPKGWNDPNGHTYGPLMVRFRHALLGDVTLSELWDAAKGEVASLAVSLIGAALCPESAGAGCLVMVGAVAGMAGQCVDDCTDVTKLALNAVIGGVMAYGAGKIAGFEPSGCSFSGDTLVLMADGSLKPIADIKDGDEVEAADPDTGEDGGGHQVTATWLNHDQDLVDLQVQLADGSSGTLHTTSNHPFRDATTGTWTPAGELPVGDTLVTPSGDRIRVTAVTPLQGEADMHNLTVADLHTYYVVAGGTPVLVHNICPPTKIVLGVDGPALADLMDPMNAEPGQIWFHHFSDGFGGAGELGDYTDFFNHFRASLEPSSTTKLVFDLTDVDGGTAGARAWAETVSASDLASNPSHDFTAWELAQIMKSPKSVRDRVEWRGGSDPFADLP
ncbi:polymorphic toxin-type HINT domain-containing protein [Kitasatospora cineracea]|uniref:polymorphic toxin-type HINT domain-containing protein n=1 Tax=Kitasatospora cineracea TaxID=88074 RepID=UPI0033EBB06D